MSATFDPNETLSLMRARMADLLQFDPTEGISYEEIASDLALQFEALDDWLCQNGTMPTSWAVG